jgi:riboflavin synthase
MFTGLIETTGTIQSLTKGGGAARIVVTAPAALIGRLHTGDSIAVSGVCLTALDIDTSKNTFAADLAAETLARTGLPQLRGGSLVNLELPTPAGTPLGGHIVQGHVDDVGTLESLEPLDKAHPETTDWRLRLKIPANCIPYVVEKGSITVEGISLTVARMEGDHVTIAIIPHTYAATNLHSLAPRSTVNIEADVLAKYAEQRAKAAQSFELTVDYLIANGY